MKHLLHCFSGFIALFNVRRASILCSAAAALSLGTSSSFATDRVWGGATSTVWSLGTNWVGGNAPAAGDNAVFSSTFTLQPGLTGNSSVGGVYMTTGVGQNVTISGGSNTLTLSGNTIGGTAGLGILVDNPNGFTLTINTAVKLGGAQTWRNSSGNLLTIGGTVNLNNNGLTVDGTGNTTISGIMSSGGTVTKAGTGTLTLSGANTYTGQTLIQNGTVSVNTLANTSSSSSLGAPTTAANGTIAIGSTTTGATLTYTGATTSTNRVVNLAGTTGGATLDASGTGALTFTSAFTATGAGSKTLTLTGSNTNANTISGAIVDNSVTNKTSLLKNGAGTWVLSGANTYTGTTTVNAGTLKIGANNSLPNTAVTVSGTGAGVTATLDLNGFSDTVASLSLGGSTTTSGAAIATGAGTLTLGGNVTYDATNNPLGATISGLLALGATRTFAVGDSTSAASDLSISAVVSGSGFGLTKTGAGTLVLSGSNTYTGQTLIQAGTVSVNTLANVSSNSALGGPTTVANGTIGIGSTTTGATLTYTGATTSTNRVIDLAGTTGGATLDASGSGAVTFTSAFTATGAGSKTLTLTGSNTNNNTISGAIVDNSGTNKTSLAKSGTGTWVLSGANTFTGTTTVNGGTLTLATGSGSALGSTSAITINSGGTLLLGASNQINDTATITMDNGSTLSRGTFNEGGIGTAGMGAVTLSANGAHIDFGTGAVGVLTFASLTTNNFTINIDNWTGNYAQQGSGSTDRLIFDNDQTSNLGNFYFTGYGTGATQFDLGNGFFELVAAVPEPSAWVPGALAVALIISFHGVRMVRRRSADRRIEDRS